MSPGVPSQNEGQIDFRIFPGHAQPEAFEFFVLRRGICMLIDLHTHTHPLSLCSNLSLTELVVWSRAAGLDGLCLTEHDTMSIYVRQQRRHQSGE